MRSILQGCLIAVLLLAAGPIRAQTIIEEWNSVKAPPPPALKDVTIDPKKTALLVLDFRKDACSKERRPRCAEALPQVVKLLTMARAKGMMIIHTTTTSSTPDDIPTELKPAAGEQLFKSSMDKLAGTDIPEQFKVKGIDTVIISGTSANGAVLATAGGTAFRGFKVVVPVDTMPAEGAYQEQLTVFQIANAPTLREMSTLTKVDMLHF